MKGVTHTITLHPSELSTVTRNRLIKVLEEGYNPHSYSSVVTKIINLFDIPTHTGYSLFGSLRGDKLKHYKAAYLLKHGKNLNRYASNFDYKLFKQITKKRAIEILPSFQREKLKWFLEQIKEGTDTTKEI